MRQTRPSLLLRIRNFDDRESWQDFVDLYGPVIVGYLRGVGVGRDDAADLGQEVLHIVARRIESFTYDPKIGRFRAWLRKVTVNRARRFFLQRRREVAAAGGTVVQELLQQLPDPAARDDDRWERQWRRRVLQVAMRKVRSHVKEPTWQAFEMVAIEGRTAQEAAEKLHVSIGQIYVSKSRVIKRLRETVETIHE